MSSKRRCPSGTEAASPAEAARANVAAYAAMLAVPFANPTVEALLAAFAALPPKGGLTGGGTHRRLIAGYQEVGYFSRECLECALILGDFQLGPMP